MWVEASDPVNDKADCSRPRVQAKPGAHPVSLLKVVKTYAALRFSAVASRVMLTTTTPRIDQ